MDRTRSIALVVAIAAGMGVATISQVRADDVKPPSAQPTPPAADETARPHQPGWRGAANNRPPLFTQAERDQFAQKMKSANTPEERETVRKEMRAALEQRARERGLPMARGPAQGDRAKLGSEDHQRFQQRWDNAKTNEEQEALRKEMMATIDQRSQPGADARPPARRERGPMAQLVSPEERAQFREKMSNAKDRDERRKIMQDMHAMVEARAKEKGIQLPDRPRMGPHPMQRPRPDEGGTRPQG